MNVWETCTGTATSAYSARCSIFALSKAELISTSDYTDQDEGRKQSEAKAYFLCSYSVRVISWIRFS